MTTPDLSPEEREALERAWRSVPVSANDLPNFVAMLVPAVLAAVPRLREGDSDDDTLVRLMTAKLMAAHDRGDKVAVLCWHNALARLAVVEVATPTEEKDDG